MAEVAGQLGDSHGADGVVVALLGGAAHGHQLILNDVSVHANAVVAALKGHPLLAGAVADVLHNKVNAGGFGVAGILQKFPQDGPRDVLVVADGRLHQELTGKLNAAGGLAGVLSGVLAGGFAFLGLAVRTLKVKHWSLLDFMAPPAS